MKGFFEWVGIFAGGSAGLNIVGSLNVYTKIEKVLIILFVILACTAGGIVVNFINDNIATFKERWNGRKIHLKQQY